MEDWSVLLKRKIFHLIGPLQQPAALSQLLHRIAYLERSLYLRKWYVLAYPQLSQFIDFAQTLRIGKTAELTFQVHGPKAILRFLLRTNV